MERREVLKTVLKAGLLATVSAALAHPLGKVFHRSVHPDNRSVHPDTTDINKSIEEQDKIASNKLMEKYEIPTFEAAEALYQRVLSERAAYYAGGAVVGSVVRSANNEVNSSSRRAFLHRVANVFAGAGTIVAVGNPVTKGIEAIKESPLTRPETLINEYGLSSENAETFCNRYSHLLAAGAQAGAMTATFLQELFLPLPKEEVLAVPEHSDAVS